MKLLPADERALQEALRGVVMAAEACAQQPDTEAVRQALSATWRAVLRAQREVNEAEVNAHRAAQRTLETVA